jgi:Tfp pilus assembly protein PilO
MRRNELTILASLAVVGLMVAFWLFAISPKRNQAATLKDDVDQLRSELQQTQQAAAAGDQARRSFDSDYRKLVVLGKAVPADGDQASLLIQLQRLADRSGVRFDSIELQAATGSTSGSSSSTAPAPATGTSDSSSASSASPAPSTSSEPASPTSTVATESAAATLPIGASVGPAGLPVMPYDVTFAGGFFQIADFLEGLDRMVQMRHGSVAVSGRLLTVDGFTLQAQAQASTATGATGPSASRNPVLAADLSVTTFLTPADEGITAGAAPGGPASPTPTPATTTPASSSMPAPTATATPASVSSGTTP